MIFKWLNFLAILFVMVGCGNSSSDSSGLVVQAPENSSVPLNDLSIDSLVDINAANASSYSLSGTCSPDGSIIALSLGGQSQSSSCSSGIWSVSSWDLSALSDSTSLTLSADLKDAQGTVLVSASSTFAKDVVAPTVTIDPVSNITLSNVASYALGGACDEEGGTVYVSLGTLSSSTTCSSGSWSISAWDVSAQGDGVAIAIAADLADAAGNNAISATDVVDKDAVMPVIAITAPLDASYINSATDSSVFAINGTCNVSGATVSLLIDGLGAAGQVDFACDGVNFSGTIDTTGIADAAFVMTAEITKDSVTASSSNINITKDTLAPTITLNAPNVINGANANSYSLSGTCSENGSVTVDVGGVSQGTTCSASTWAVSSLDVSAVADNAAVAITVDMVDSAGNNATQVLGNILKDTAIPTVAITSSPDINASNYTTYTLVGSCSEDGQSVSVSIGALAFSPACSGGAFSVSNVDVSSLVDSPAIAITADISDAAGNAAVQASTSVVKDVATPTVTLDIFPSVTQANVTSYVVSGTCSENGRLVVVNIGSINVNPYCSSGAWSSSFVDVSSLADGPVIITVDHDNASAVPATQASETVTKDTTAPTVTISSASDITVSNMTSYVVSGTCSESGRLVDINIDTLNFTPTCSASNSWSTGLVDVSSLPDGSATITADHDNASSVAAVQASRTVTKAISIPTVANLSVATSLVDSIDLTWSLNDPGGFTIDDYIINYRVKGTSTWLLFSDGVSTSLNTTVTSLNASTTYEFQVAVKYDSSSQSPWSNIAEGATQPNSPVFGANKAMNVGGATSSTVVAHQDNTSVTLNGSALVTLNKGQTHTFTSAQFDVIDADKPIFTAGRKGSGGDTNKANVVWQPTAWAGKSFSFNSIRYNPQVLQVFAIEDTYIEVKQGSTVLDTLTLSANTGGSLSWSVYGSYQVSATGSILAYHYSNQSGSYVDPKPILPSAYELIGIPSRSMRLTADLDGTNYYGYHSDSFAFSGSLNKVDNISYNARGTLSYYQEYSMIFFADKKISGAAFADANGSCTTPFLPTNLMKKKYAINVSATYVAFASKEAGTIQVLDQSDNVVQTLTLTRSGAEANAPYKARRGTTNAGYRFISTVPVYGVYEPSTDTGGADNDETIMYGTDL